MEENKNHEPKIFKVLRFIAPCMVVAGVVLIVLASTVFSKETWHGKDPNLAFLMPGIALVFFSIPVFFAGFIPKIQKTAIKTQKYLQQENKEDLTDIANTTADITGGAITKTTRAIKKGIKDTKFCKHCGAEIDADSKFCNSCGGEQ